MSEDIIERLRREQGPLCQEAAAEIEQLRDDLSRIRSVYNFASLEAEIERLRACVLSDEEIGALQAAVENLRSPDKAESRTIDAAWRIASKLEQIANRLS
jgi:hypothetical protein